MIGNHSPAEMRHILREKLALSDAELLATFNKEIAEAKARAPESLDAGEALRLLRDALLKETVQPKRVNSKKRKATTKK